MGSPATASASSSLASAALLLLALGSAQAWSISTDNRPEAQFRVFDVDDGALAEMSVPFSPERFEVSAEEVSLDGGPAFIFYLKYFPERALFLCFTQRSDSVLPGDLLYVFNPDGAEPEFKQPLKVPLYATKEQAEAQQLGAMDTGADRRMAFATELIQKNPGFAAAFSQISFSKLQLKPWSYKIGMAELAQMESENETILSAIGDSRKAFGTPPAGADAGQLLELLAGRFLDETEGLKAFFEAAFQPTKAGDRESVQALQNMLGRNAKELVAALRKMKALWGNLDALKAEAQAHYLRPLLGGDENILLAALKGPKWADLDVNVGGTLLLDWAVKKAVDRDPRKAEKFPVLAQLEKLKNKKLSLLLKFMDSGAMMHHGKSSAQAVAAEVAALKEKIQSAFDQLITEIQYMLAGLSPHQVEAFGPALSQYVQATQARHGALELFDGSQPLKVKLRDLAVTFWDRHFADPSFFGFSGATPPFLVKGRRRNLLV